MMFNAAKRYFRAVVMASTLILALVFSAACSNDQTIDSKAADTAIRTVADAVNAEAADLEQRQNAAKDVIGQLDTLHFPSAWVVGEPWAENGTRVEVLALPGRDVAFTHDGQVVAPGDPKYEFPVVMEHDPANAVVSLGEVQYELPADHLLVNLPDFLPGAIYDAAYAYSAPSDCGGIPIEGLTGCVVNGYENVIGQNDYRGLMNVPAVPCAYRTFEKIERVEQALESQGYRLVVWDCYRPYRASVFLSDRFSAAYDSNPAIPSVLGSWSREWYVANGPSGHNFGIDIDVGVAYADTGAVVENLPSHFDAFDDSAHLTDSGMNASSISEANYKAEVVNSPACLALHRAFAAEGFEELSSEWWHFGDIATQGQIQAAVGYEGLDFLASNV